MRSLALPPVARRAVWYAAATFLLAGGALIHFAGGRRDGTHAQPTTGQTTDAAAESTEHAEARVVLPPEKLKAAGLHSTEVNRRRLQQLRTVPGKIDYRGIRRVDIKSPVDSVVHQVLVKPGDTVSPGSRLALLDSPEIGLARAEMERNSADLTLAEQNRDWAEKLSRNLDDLIRFLEQTPEPNRVEQTFEDKVLGDHGQKVLAAYSRFHLADELYADIKPAAEKGSVSMQLVKQRQSNREVAKAEFRGASEQSRFDALQERRKTLAGAEYAARILAVSRQKLRTLLGANSELVELPESVSGDLTRYYLIAPFAGTVEQRHIAGMQRVAAGTLLYVVADTRELDVTADLRERNWQALTLSEGAAVGVQVPALNGRAFTALVEYVGRAISPDTQALPLVAILQNPEGLLKPGMFAWVSLPTAENDDSLVVPPSAVLTHEGKKFVFVEEGPSTFRRVDVTTGMETENWVAITHGLEASQKVVDRGAFLLKSELLLESEED